nr:MFS transporter [Streptacidiphilus anmyonensis]
MNAAPRDLTLYWWGQTASAFGSVFTAVALPVVAVVQLGASPAQVAQVSAAATLPVLLLGLPVGVLVDRIARPRRALLTLDTVSAAAVGVVALGLAGHLVTIGWLVLLALVQGAVTVVTEVVYFVHLRQLTESTDGGGTSPLARARARLQAGEFGAGLVGRLLAGPTIVVLGAAAALAVDGLSYLLSLAALLTMRRAAAAPRTPAAGRAARPRDAFAGLRLLVGDDFRRALTVFLVAPVFAAAGVTALTAPFLLRVLHVPAAVYGVTGAAAGLLGMVGSIVASRVLAPHRDARRIMAGAFTCAIGAALLLPLAGGPLPVALCCAALGIGVPIFFGSIANVALGPVLVCDVAEEATGRVIATLQVVAAAATTLGAITGGALGEWLGVRSAMWGLDLGALAAVLLALPTLLRSGRPGSTPAGRRGTGDAADATDVTAVMEAAAELDGHLGEPAHLGVEGHGPAVQ